MIKIIRGAEVYAPEKLGVQDILISGNKIIAIAQTIEIDSEYVEVNDASGMIATPGFIDSLVHIIGGGGEGGFTTRTPEVQLTDLTLAGTTTLVAALGTDSITRSLEALLAKAKELNALGLNCFIYSGSYHLPVKTITGDLQKDISLISECIGVGEIAVADHRGSQVCYRRLAEIAGNARVGGMLANKCGIVSIHMGDGREMFDPLFEVVNRTAIPISQFYPTHVNRNAALFEQGILFAQQGGYIDLTTSSNKASFDAGEIKCSQALRQYLDIGGNIGQLTFSSDGHASLPEFNVDGELISLEVGYESSLFREVRDAVLEENVPFEVALQVITSSPANILCLQKKGYLKVNYDADINLLDANTLAIDTVISQGEIMVKNKQPVIKGRFEK